MSNYEATKYNFNGADLTGIEGIPTATIIEWSDSSIPSGFLECDGSAVSRTTYSALFAIIGTTYGTGDGSSTFNLPDLQDKVIIGKSNNKTLGSTGGANATANAGNVGGSTANATISTPQLPPHSHPGNTSSGSGNVSGPSNRTTTSGNSGNTGGSGAHSHNMSATFTGDSTSVVQPYLTIIYIIKT